MHNEAALAFASHDLDSPGTLEAKLQLASILLARARQAGPQKGAEDLSAAAELCADMKPMLDGQIKRSRLQLIEIDARVQIEQATETEHLNTVEESLVAALAEDPETPPLHRALADMYDKRQNLAI